MYKARRGPAHHRKLHPKGASRRDSTNARLPVRARLQSVLGKRNHEFESNPLRQPVLLFILLSTLGRNIAFPADNAAMQRPAPWYDSPSRAETVGTGPERAYPGESKNQIIRDAWTKFNIKD